jgi:gluconolactonase
VTDSGTDAESFFENGAVCKDFAGRAYDGGVFRISRRSLSVSRVDRGLRFANGIAFDGNGRLYVNETLTGWIYTYNVGKGPPFRREKFANVFDGESQASGPATLHGPDGMKFGSDGRLYCTVYGVGVIAVLDREGAVVDKIQTIGMLPTNIAFDARGYPRAYVTEVEHGCVELLEMPCGGLALYE